MPTVWTPTGKMVAKHTLPTDGDNLSAASFNTPLQSIGDYTKVVQALALRNWSTKLAQLTVGLGSTMVAIRGWASGVAATGEDVTFAVGDRGSTGTGQLVRIPGVQTPSLDDSSGPSTVGSWSCIAYSAAAATNKWVALAKPTPSSGVDVAMSANGSTWTTATTGGTSVYWHGIAASSGGVFVGVGWTALNAGKTVRLAGGASPVVADLAAERLSIAFGAGLFVAAGGAAGGGSPVVYTSPDGITWTARAFGGIRCIRGITWNGSVFVTLGDLGEVYTSPDGIAWTSSTLSTVTGMASSRGAIAADPVTGAIVLYSNTTQGVMFSVDNGKTFQRCGLISRSDPSYLQFECEAVGFADGRFWIGAAPSAGANEIGIGYTQRIT